MMPQWLSPTGALPAGTARIITTEPAKELQRYTRKPRPNNPQRSRDYRARNRDEVNARKRQRYAERGTYWRSYYITRKWTKLTAVVLAMRP